MLEVIAGQICPDHGLKRIWTLYLGSVEALVTCKLPKHVCSTNLWAGCNLAFQQKYKRSAQASLHMSQAPATSAVFNALHSRGCREDEKGMQNQHSRAMANVHLRGLVF